MSYRAVCFDIDGTMGDTFPLCVPLFQQVFARFAGRQLTHEQVIAEFGVHEEGLIQRVVGENWQSAVQAYYAGYRRGLEEQHVDPFPGIRELIAALKERGTLLLLLTGKGERCCRITLEYWQLNVFDGVRCGDAERNNKPEQLKAFMQEFDLMPQEICYLGDALSDFTACRAVGVPCLSALWQQIPHDKDKLLKLNASMCCGSVAEAAAYLLPRCVPYAAGR